MYWLQYIDCYILLRYTASGVHTCTCLSRERHLFLCINSYRFSLPSWAASVPQFVEHLHGMQFVIGSSPVWHSLFILQKKSCLQVHCGTPYKTEKTIWGVLVLVNETSCSVCTIYQNNQQTVQDYSQCHMTVMWHKMAAKEDNLKKNFRLSIFTNIRVYVC